MLSHRFLLEEPPEEPSFIRVPLSDRDFDLTPLYSNTTSIHVLMDDVVLRIFEYLPLNDLIKVERVCRRWQSLVYESFRTKANGEIKGDIDMFLIKNDIDPNIYSLCKILILCGRYLTGLSFGKRFVGDNLLKMIAQLCPEIKSLSLYNPSMSDENLEELVMSCKKITEFKIKECSLYESQLCIILKNLTTLEVLSLLSPFEILWEFDGTSFVNLPNTLKVLNISLCSRAPQESVYHIIDRCPLLEVLWLDNISISSNTLTQIGKGCTGLKELSIRIAEISPNVDMKPFFNLKKLTFCGVVSSINKLITDLPHLQELHLNEVNKVVSFNEVIDFSALPNIRILSLPEFTTNMSLKTLTNCSKLEEFMFDGGNEHKPAILEIIRRCQSLKELDISNVTLYSDDIANFVDANKNRKDLLKMTVEFDESAFGCWRELDNANYKTVAIVDNGDTWADIGDHHGYSDDSDYY